MTLNYDLVPNTNPILKTTLDDFDFNNPPINPEELALEMIRIMNEHKGYGLSANQIGLSYRVFALASEPAYVCFNPKIVWESEETIYLDEGCLSFPGLVVKIKRPRHVRLRFQTPNGNITTKKFTGITARAIQHEMDHLNGILFYEKANRFHREKAFKRFNRNKKLLTALKV